MASCIQISTIFVFVFACAATSFGADDDEKFTPLFNAFADHVNAQRLPHVAAFALLPAVLQAAANVELGEFSAEQVSRAIAAWQLPQLADLDAAALVTDWWQTYLADKPAWPVALTALDQMLG